jgi:uncharacterized membrane protein
MNPDGRNVGLERHLATMLRHGTGVGSCIIAAGWVMSVIGEPALLRVAAVTTVRAGITLFIVLPVLRVLLMAVVFFRGRDYRFGAIAGLVLAIIILGAGLGVCMAGAYPTP